jgi:hypothetical protein
MEVSPNVLRKETVATLKEVDQLLELYGNMGPAVRAPLLLAKAQCLNTLTMLSTQAQDKKRR